MSISYWRQLKPKSTKNYRVSFWSYRFSFIVVFINRKDWGTHIKGTLKIEEPWDPATMGWGVTNPLIASPSPYVLPRQIWHFCDKRCTRKYKETPKIGERWSLLRSAWKIWPIACRLSRSLKVTETVTYRSATYGFLFTFHSNHGPTSYHFRDKRQFQSKIANISHPRLFNAPAEGTPLEVGRPTCARRKKTSMMGLTGRERRKEVWRYLQPFESQL